MYEGQFNKAGVPEVGEAADLRRFRWTDLVAKIAATRDLREEMARIEGGFGAFADVRRESSENGKTGINHDILANGKPGAVDLGNTENDPAQGDRETE
ncbi:hypothetical protein [Qipengyuania zhejiangensis]|uniref:hypothetical protein n=1 Tax=Qipengyuania zhejiangensis TaxID=3077782 RepID=UPI002D76934E|nr:hypothetical protein [Qipengyuania sp. Z2]